jgi:hypothetical protein
MLGARKITGDGSELAYGLYRAGSDFLRRDLCLENSQATNCLSKVFGASRTHSGKMLRLWASAKE